MTIWAIADLHLSFGVADKQMEVFGPQWVGYTEKIESAWKKKIKETDLVLIAGDISWAKHPEEALPDLIWIDRLPGIKLLIKGNHDYWWGSPSKLKTIIPTSCHLLKNASWTWNEVSIAGTRLWDTPGLSFDGFINYSASKPVKSTAPKIVMSAEECEKVYKRELGRLETSLKSMDPKAKLRIAMTHYPPIGPHLEETEASRLLEKYGVNICVFGHLHNVKKENPLFGVKNGVHYCLTACDYLDNFNPLRIS